MTAFDDLLAANDDHVARFTTGMLPAPPARALAVLTCMDARILPLDAMGLAVGDAHVVRNAGGRVTDDALRSLLVSAHAMGVRKIAVIHHTECGVAKSTDEEFRQLVLDATGHDPDPIRLLAIADPDQALADDVRTLATSPLLPEGTEVAGFRYDIRTGRLHLVSGPGIPRQSAGFPDQNH
ncbi:MAG TPA: carbonic anhydrase [Acidimicrobiales bacterium]|nr:carbonic anhydrase [Acidimicrobiales bacterium]